MTEKVKKKDGRPRIDFDWEALDKLCSYKMSLADCAELLKCHQDTILNRIREKHGITFSKYRNKKLAPTRISLVKKAIEMAKGGNNTMMIFCLKNLCHWSDQVFFDESDEEEELSL